MPSILRWQEQRRRAAVGLGDDPDFRAVGKRISREEAEATDEIADRPQCAVYLVKVIELDYGMQPDQLSMEEIQNFLRPIV